MGKALIEKLLRSNPQISRIYVLLRSKRNKTIEERLKVLLEDAVFKRVRTEQPDCLAKIVAIEGDCCKLQLGISSENLQKLKSVNIVYHSAASVRYRSISHLYTDDILTTYCMY